MIDVPPISRNGSRRPRRRLARIARGVWGLKERDLFRIALIAWLLPMPVMNARANALRVMIPLEPPVKTCCLPCAVEKAKPAAPSAGRAAAGACCVCVTLADTFLFDSGNPAAAAGISPSGRTPVSPELRPSSLAKPPLVPPPRAA